MQGISLNTDLVCIISAHQAYMKMSKNPVGNVGLKFGYFNLTHR